MDSRIRDDSAYRFSIVDSYLVNSHNLAKNRW
jgi:hypothetical protein